MKYSNELLESGLLAKYMPKASFFAVCDWLNKSFGEVELSSGIFYGNTVNHENIAVHSGKVKLGFIAKDEFNEVCYFDNSGLCIYKPNLDNQFDSANQYD